MVARDNEAAVRGLPTPIPVAGDARISWFEDLAWRLQVDTAAMADLLRSGSGLDEERVAFELDRYEEWLVEQVRAAVETGRLASNVEGRRL